MMCLSAKMLLLVVMSPPGTKMLDPERSGTGKRDLKMVSPSHRHLPSTGRDSTYCSAGVNAPGKRKGEAPPSWEGEE